MENFASRGNSVAKRERYCKKLRRKLESVTSSALSIFIPRERKTRRSGIGTGFPVIRAFRCWRRGEFLSSTKHSVFATLRDAVTVGKQRVNAEMDDLSTDG